MSHSIINSDIATTCLSCCCCCCCCCCTLITLSIHSFLFRFETKLSNLTHCIQQITFFKLLYFCRKHIRMGSLFLLATQTKLEKKSSKTERRKETKLRARILHALRVCVHVCLNVRVCACVN
jgi:hypothetical protein